MDKYEYKQKIDELLDCVAVGDYIAAESIADAVDWRRVKNVNMLYTVSEVYDQCGRYEDAREILFIAYDRAPNNRRIIFGLAELAIKTGQRIEARDCYDEFVAVAPHDPGKYILQYEILKNEDAPIEEQIEALEKYKKQDYTERWSYELAKLYEKAGMTAKCIAECDDLFLWFSEGRYVYKALELKRKYRPLTANQTDALNSAQGYESEPDEYENPEDVVEQYGQAGIDAEFDEQFISEYQYDDAESELEESESELGESIAEMQEISGSDDYDDNIQNANPLYNTRDFGEEFAKAQAEEEQKNLAFQAEMERQADFEVDDLSANIAQFVNEFVDETSSESIPEKEETENNEMTNEPSYEDAYEGSEETESGLKIDYYGDLSAAIMSQLTAKVPVENVKETISENDNFEEAISETDNFEEEAISETDNLEEEAISETGSLEEVIEETEFAAEDIEQVTEKPLEETIEETEDLISDEAQEEQAVSEDVSAESDVQYDSIPEPESAAKSVGAVVLNDFREFENASRFDFIAEQEQRLKAERAETERLKNELAEVMRRKAEMEESVRLRDEKEAAEKLAAAQAEAARIAAEKLAAAQAESKKREELAAIEAKEAARIAAEELRLSGEAAQAEAFRLETEQFEAARLEAEKLEAEREEAERIEAERIIAEQTEAKLQAELAAIAAKEAALKAAEEMRLSGEAEQAEAYRLETEQVEAARLEVEKFEAEQAKAARIEAEKLVAAQEEARLARESARNAEEAALAEELRLETEQADYAIYIAEQAEAARLKAEKDEAIRQKIQAEAVAKMKAEREEAERWAIAAEREVSGEAEVEEAERLAAEAERSEVDRLTDEFRKIRAEKQAAISKYEEIQQQILEQEQAAAKAKEEAERLARMAEREKEKEEIELERKAAINRARQEQETRMEAVRKYAREEAERIAVQRVELRRFSEEAAAREAAEIAAKEAYEAAQNEKIEALRKVAREEAEKLASQRAELERAKNRIAEEEAARIAQRKAYDDEQQKMMDETIRKRVEAATTPLIDQIASLTMALKHQTGEDTFSANSSKEPEIKTDLESATESEIKDRIKVEPKAAIEPEKEGIPKFDTKIGTPDSNTQEHYEVDNIAAALADLAFSKDIDFSKLEKEGREELERKLAQKKASLYESLSRRSIVGSPDRNLSGDSVNGIPLEKQFDLEAQRSVGLEAGLTEEQKNLFSYFVPVRGMSEQLVEVLRKDLKFDRRGTSCLGNITITGPSGNGKTVLGVDLVKAIQKQRAMRSGKIAIIGAEALNRKDIPDTIAKIIGGALIIEDAGSLSQSTVVALNDIMEGNTKETLFVLEDQKEALDALFNENPKFAFKFGSSIEVPVFVDDELVTFGMSYAREHGYKIDEMGILALYSRIDILQREDHNVTVAEVKEIMDDAFDHARQSSMRRTMTSLFKRNDTSELTSLREEDFA